MRDGEWITPVVGKEDLSNVHRIVLVKPEGKRLFRKTRSRCRIKVKRM
jgi:hypothetical protein